MRTASPIKDVFAGGTMKENTDTAVTRNTHFIEVLSVQVQRGTLAVKDLRNLYLYVGVTESKIQGESGGLSILLCCHRRAPASPL